MVAKKERKPNVLLRTERKNRGWSQARLAEIIGADTSMVSRWECGERKPEPHYQEKLCNLYSKSAIQLGFLKRQETIQSLTSVPNPTSSLFANTSNAEFSKYAVYGSNVSLLNAQSDTLTQTQPENLILSSDVIHVETLGLETKDWAVWFGLKVAQVLRVVGLSSGLSVTCDDIQAIVAQEINVMDEMLQQYQINAENSISRRQALVTIAALPTTLVATLKHATSPTDVVADEFLAQCTASITACWYLLKGKGINAISEVLPQFTPLLTDFALRPSKHQQTAASLATQASILQAILAMHRLDIRTREKYCNDAIRYSRISGDIRLQAAAAMYLGYTFSFCYSPNQPEKAISLFQQGLHVLGDEASLLRSDILMGLADAYAQCRDEQQALHCMDCAQSYFPENPKYDPSYIYADCDFNVLYQWQGIMYLKLAKHYPERKYQQKADSALIQSMEAQSISERSMNATIVYQADVARLLGDLDIYTEHLRNAAQMAVKLGSRKRFHQALTVYHQTPEKWLVEQKIQLLARDVFRQFPVGENS